MRKDPGAGPSDEDLMKSFQEGRGDSMEALSSRHLRTAEAFARMVCGSVPGYDAQDVAQEAFLRILRCSGSYGYPAIFTTWLYTIVRNLCFNNVRNRSRHPILSLDDKTPGGSGIGDVIPSPDNPCPAETRDEAETLLLRATPADGMAVWLHHGLGMSLQATASRLGCSERRVKTSIQAGMRKMRSGV